MLACITATGELHVLDVRNGGKAVHAPAHMIHLLQGGQHGGMAALEKLQVKSNGVAVITTSHPSAYIYDGAKSAFSPLLTPHQLAGSPLIASIGASTSERTERGGRQRGGASAPSGPVGAIEAQVVELWRKAQVQAQQANGQEAKPEWWDVAMTLQHLDMRMRACELLESKEEYRGAMKAYAQIIGQEGFRGRAEELVRDLLGPLYQSVNTLSLRKKCCGNELTSRHAERNSKWQSEVAGLAKRDVLRMILSVFCELQCDC